MTDDQFRMIAVLLTEIRDGIYGLVAVLTESDEEATECQHPEDKRVSFATPGQPNRWMCSVCRNENGIVN